MVAGVYLAASAAEHIDEAQAVVDAHPVSASTELCMTCGTDGPCRERRRALRVLARYGRLPRRRPGATRDNPVELRRPGFDWFSDGCAVDPAPAPGFESAATSRPCGREITRLGSR